VVEELNEFVEKKSMTGPNASCVKDVIGFPDKLMTAPLAYLAIYINLYLENQKIITICAFVSPGNAAAAIVDMLFKDKSMRRIEAASPDKSFAPTDVIELEASFKLINCVYLTKLAGILVSRLELKSIVSTGDQVGMLSIFVPTSVRL